MKTYLMGLGRLLTVSAVAFGLSTFANYENHKGYWQDTIHRVQTVDFNILSNMLPTKLSYVLQKGAYEEIQRTVNSNYGLFGIVVTDCKQATEQCPNQTILYSSESPYLDWFQEIQIETLTEHPFDYLKDPPPLTAENGFANPESDIWNRTGRVNTGNIIGRVYYVRGDLPQFLPSYGQWLSQLPESLVSTRGTSKYYALTTVLFMLGGITFWSMFEVQLYRKRVKCRFAEQQKFEAETEARILASQLEENVSQSQQWLAERESLFAKLQEACRERQTRIQNLRKILEKKDQQLQQKMALLKQYHEELEQRQGADAQGVTDSEYIDNTEAIKHDIEVMKDESTKAYLELEQLQHLKDTEHSITQHFATEKAILEKRIEKYQADLIIARKKIDDLEETADAYEEVLRKNREKALNKFEREVLKCLQASPRNQSGEWRVLSQVDISESKPDFPSQFVDFIVVSKYCVFAIEAKSCRGEVFAEGNTKRSTWKFKPKENSQPMEMKSVGTNPYEQIARYTQSLLNVVSPASQQRFSRRSVGRHQQWAELRVYGVIVFPKGVNYKDLGQKIGRDYRITTLDELVDMLDKRYETQILAASRQQTQSDRLSPKQVESLIRGSLKPNFS